MGNFFIAQYRKINDKCKLAFCSAFIVALLVHLYKFVNTLPNADSLFSVYHSQNIVDLGRWFLSWACGISSYFDLPWITGLLSCVYMASTAAIIVDIFKIKNSFLIVLTGGLLVSFPSVSETLFFGYTADGYFLAMLLSAIAVRLCVFDSICWRNVILSTVLICLSCGIYQAYISFSLILSVCYLLNEILESRRTDKECWQWILKHAVVYIAALVLYWVIWKLCLSFQDVAAKEYRGVSELASGQLEFSLGSIFSSLKAAIYSLVLFFVEWNVFEHGFNLYGILNVLFVPIFTVGFGYVVAKSGLLRKKTQLVIAVLCIIAIIPFAFICVFVTPGVGYSPRMLGSLSILLIFCAILYDRWFKERTSTIIGLFLALVVFNNSLLANIAYHYMHQQYEMTYSTGQEMTSRIYALDTDNDFSKIVIVGNRELDVGLGGREIAGKAQIFTAAFHEDLCFDTVHVSLVLKNIFKLDYEYATESECMEYEMHPDIVDMGVWPASDSVAVVDDVLVIKLSESPQNANTQPVE